MQLRIGRTSDGQDQLPLAIDELREPITKAGGREVRAPAAITKRVPVKVTEVYDTYWRFAFERQEIYFRRLSGESPPWTNDPILHAHRFTNAYRAADRVSQYLVRRVIYQGDSDPGEVLFRIILFKLFNKIATWELLEDEFGEIRWADWRVEEYDRVLCETTERGQSIYSAAYIMPPVRTFGHQRKHRNHLALLEQMMEDWLPKKVTEADSLCEVFQLLRAYPGIGNFLAYQYAIDLNYSSLCDFPESDFVVPGPGALDGINKCFYDLGGLTEAEVIELVAQSQEEEFARLGLEFKTLWGRQLQLIDCQNLFCEVDKYARLAHPEVRGRSGRTHIKQKYRRHPQPFPRPWFPPKWGMYGRIEKELPDAGPFWSNGRRGMEEGGSRTP